MAMEQRSDARLHQLLDPRSEALEDCLLSLAPADAVVLVDRGVELVLDGAGVERLAAAAATVAALAADLAARGLRPPEGVVALDDAAWARMVRQFPTVLSWS